MNIFEGIKDTIKVVLEWLQNSGFGEVINLGTLGTLIGTIFVSVKNIKKNNADLIVAQTEKMQLSKEQKETRKEIDDIKENQSAINETLNKAIGLMFIMLNNSKISAEAKQQALEVFNSTTKEVKNVVASVEEIVEKIQNEIEKNISEEPKEEYNPYLKNVEQLINETKVSN